MLPAHVAVNLEKIYWPTVVATEFEAYTRAIGIVVEEVTQVRMGDCRTQNQLHVQMAVGLVRILHRRRAESHHNVGILALGMDEASRVGFPLLQLFQHLLNRVTAFRGITVDFPGTAQFFWRVKKYLDVVELTHGRSVEAEQSFHNDELTWLHVFRPHQRA